MGGVDDDGRRTLRLALAMRGGVSLAVWIGGAVAEIDVLRRGGAAPRQIEDSVYSREQQDASRRRGEAYRQLLELCGHRAVEVDVLAGASAGGLNAVLYATALLRGTTVDHLDQVWVRLGGLWGILRPHRVLGEVTSLLAGDDFFAPSLHEALRELMRRNHAPALAAHTLSVDLSATVLDPDAREEQAALDGRGHLHLDRRPAPALPTGDTNPMTDLPDLTGTDPGDAVDRTLGAFAYAGRTTSSFPFAFEPALLRSHGAPLHGDGPPTPAPGLGDDEGGPVEMSRWFAAHRDPNGPERPYHVVDGGVLDNIPVDRALQAVEAMPTDGPTQRTLLFLDPDPARELPPTATVDRASSVLLRTKTIRSRGERLSDELAAIRAHNEREAGLDARFSAVADSIRWRSPDRRAFDAHRDRADARWALGLLRAPAYEQLRSPYDALAVPALEDTVTEDEATTVVAEVLAGIDRRRDVAALVDAVTLLIDWARLLPSADSQPTVDEGRLADLERHLFGLRLLCRVFRRRQERGLLDQFWSPGADDDPQPRSTRDRLRDALFSLLGAPSSASVAAAQAASTGRPSEDYVLQQIGAFVASREPVDPEATEIVWAAVERCRQELVGFTAGVAITGRLRGYLVFLQPAPVLSSLVSAFTAAEAVPSTSSVIDVHVIGGDAPVPCPSRFDDLVAAARHDWVEKALRSTPQTEDERRAPPTAELLTASAKLAGNSAANFSGFLAARWRRNDWWWGRRDAAVALVDVLLASATRPPTAAELDAVTTTVWGPDAVTGDADPDRAREQLKRGFAESVEREFRAGPAGSLPVTEGAERFRNLRPVYLSGLAHRAGDLTWRAFASSAPTIPSRWARGAARALLVVVRPLVVLAPLAVNVVRAMIVVAAAFAAAAVLGGFGTPGEALGFFWGAAGVAGAGLVAVVGLVPYLRGDQNRRWDALELGEEHQTWDAAFDAFRLRGLVRAAGMVALGVVTAIVPVAAVLLFRDAVRPGAAGAVALLALAWCLAAYRAVTTGPPARTIGWSPRDEALRLLGIVVATALLAVGVLHRLPGPLSALHPAVIVGLLAVVATVAIVGGWTRWWTVVLSPLVVGAGTGAVALVAGPIGLVMAAWLVLIALTSFFWRGKWLVEAQDGEAELMRDPPRPNDPDGPGRSTTRKDEAVSALDPARANTSRRRRRSRTTQTEWTAGHRGAIAYLRVELAQARRETDSDCSTAKNVEKMLDEADDQLEAFEARGRITRLLTRTQVFSAVDAMVNEAEGAILLIASDGAVLARVPALRAEMQRYIDKTDSRYDAYSRLLDRIAGIGTGTAT